MLQYKPHLGAYAAIKGDDNRLLLIRKTRGPYTGMWDLPGGTIEDEELPEEALVREVREETGCETKSYRQLATVAIKFPYIDVRSGEERVLKHIGILYETIIEGEPSSIGDGLDSGGAHWVECERLNARNSAPFVLKAAELIKML